MGGHSAVIAGALTLAAWRWRRAWLIPLAGWWSHIVIDVFTHSADFYPVPVLLQLEDFRQVQASVFQLARAPGKKLVYLGAILLILGVFAMLYVRERRLWIWVQAQDSGSRITTALSTTRRTLDADTEFELLKKAILKDAAA